ncbi:pentapeptide repeat-containing protein [Cocleimonas flava]|uniref:Pentapeptide repeat protein n=1 Tax=Cocleimonas flava TaxID=634765 RepID=A0A4R1F736_9GAMM|nr:pentapeptide repeat-containing protein [Cocleimonas flava]TCJ88379.1 pentapeptide repeat protein [Cocleimonas flava]
MSVDRTPLKSSLSELGEKLVSEELCASEKQNDSAIDPMEIISSEDELDMILASLAEEDQVQAPEKTETPEKQREPQQAKNKDQPVVPPKPPALTVKTKPSVFEKLRSTLHVHKSTEDDVDHSHQQRLEQEKLEKERIKQEQLEKAKLEQAKLEKARLEKAKLEKAKLEKAKIEKARLEKAKLEKARLEKAKLEKARLKQAKLEKIRLERERLEAERLEEERLEAERLEAERLEAERLEAERLEEERIEAERFEAERLEAERLEAERLEAERIEAERLEAERLKAERIEAERIEAERIEAERIEAERIEAERIEAERIEAERIEAERIEAERLEAERLEAERLEAERLEKEKTEKEQKARENLELARIEQERLEIEKRENAALEKERLAMERIGREQEKLRLEREKLKHEKYLLKQQKIQAQNQNSNNKVSEPNDLAAKLNQALEVQSKKAQKNQESEALTVEEEAVETLEVVETEKASSLDQLPQNNDDVISDFEENLEKSPESGGVELFADREIEVEPEELEYFIPEKYLLSTFLHQLEIAKQVYKLIEIKCKGILIIIDHTLNTVYCNTALDSEKFEERCSMLIESEVCSISELNYDEAKTHQSFRREKPELSHSVEAFVWAASKYTSKGRMPEGTDLARIIGLKNKPVLTQLAVMPNMIEIVDLLDEGSYSLSGIQQHLGIEQANLADVYSALLSLGLIEFNPGADRANKSSASKKEDAPKKIFSRFFKRKEK